MSTQSNAAQKLTSVVLADLREEELSDSTTDSNSSSDANEEIMNAADESNSGDEDDDSDSTMTEEVPITVPQKQGKASKNTTTPKHLICACPCCMRPLTNS